jgi:hypothetical protein
LLHSSCFVSSARDCVLHNLYIPDGSSYVFVEVFEVSKLLLCHFAAVSVSDCSVSGVRGDALSFVTCAKCCLDSSLFNFLATRPIISNFKNSEIGILLNTCDPVEFR